LIVEFGPDLENPSFESGFESDKIRCSDRASSIENSGQNYSAANSNSSDSIFSRKEQD
jgi:hypothetical protein